MDWLSKVPVFGTCPECGGSAGDNPNPGEGNAPARDTTGNGFELVEYEGRWICPNCKRRLISEEEGRIASEKGRAEDTFRGEIGIIRE